MALAFGRIHGGNMLDDQAGAIYFQQIMGLPWIRRSGTRLSRPYAMPSVRRIGPDFPA